MSQITLLPQSSTKPDFASGCLTVLEIGVCCAVFPLSIVLFAVAFFSSIIHRLYYQIQKPSILLSDLKGSAKTKEVQTELVSSASGEGSTGSSMQKAGSLAHFGVATISPLLRPSNVAPIEICLHDQPPLKQLPPRTLLYYPITFGGEQGPYSTLTKDVRGYQDALKQELLLSECDLDSRSVYRGIKSGVFEGKEAALLEYCIFHSEDFGIY